METDTVWIAEPWIVAAAAAEVAGIGSVRAWPARPRQSDGEIAAAAGDEVSANQPDAYGQELQPCLLKSRRLAS